MAVEFGSDAVEVPDVVGPIVGFRSWAIFGEPDRPRLWSSYGHVLWFPGCDVAAECIGAGGLGPWAGAATNKPEPPEPHDAPSRRADGHQGYGCGLYAYSTPSALAVSASGAAVWGEVLLWGRVMRHAAGWRAQHARPHRLYLTGREALDERVLELARQYGIDAVSLPADGWEALFEHRRRVNASARASTAAAVGLAGLLDEQARLTAHLAELGPPPVSRARHALSRAADAFRRRPRRTPGRAR